MPGQWHKTNALQREIRDILQVPQKQAPRHEKTGSGACGAEDRRTDLLSMSNPCGVCPKPALLSPRVLRWNIAQNRGILRESTAYNHWQANLHRVRLQHRPCLQPVGWRLRPVQATGAMQKLNGPRGLVCLDDEGGP